MSLAIVTADQRLARQTVKGQIWGGAGVGKTTLLKTLDPATTLAIFAEKGETSVNRDDEFGPRFMGDSMYPESWVEQMQLLDGFKQRARSPGSIKELAKYRTVFIDSTSIISKQCFGWSQTQPDAFSDKKRNADGSPVADVRGAYGLLGREMSAWAWGWKNDTDVNVWLIGGLEKKEESGVKEWAPLLMGASLKNELPYIMDYSLVMARFKADDGVTYTGLFTNPITHPEYASVPVKSRVHGLEPIERPHLGNLMAKAIGITSAPPPGIQVAA